MLSKKDLITDRNVMRTYNEGRYVCFVLKNGITVKIDPNEKMEGETDAGYKG